MISFCVIADVDTPSVAGGVCVVLLEVMLENGSTEKFGNLWNERLESIDPMLTKRYPFGKVRVEEFSEFLKECGGFRVT